MLRPYAVATIPPRPPRRRQRRAVELAARQVRQLGDRFQDRGDHIGGGLFPQMEAQEPPLHRRAGFRHPRAHQPPPPRHPPPPPPPAADPPPPPNKTRPDSAPCTP